MVDVHQIKYGRCLPTFFCIILGHRIFRGDSYHIIIFGVDAPNKFLLTFTKIYMVPVPQKKLVDGYQKNVVTENNAYKSW